MEDKLLASEHMARLIETGSILYRDDSRNGMCFTNHRGGISLGKTKPDHLYVTIKAGMFMDKVNLYRNQQPIPLSAAERRRLSIAASAFVALKAKQRIDAEKSRQEEEAARRWI